MVGVGAAGGTLPGGSYRVGVGVAMGVGGRDEAGPVEGLLAGGGPSGTAGEAGDPGPAGRSGCTSRRNDGPV